jgi:hypothetical protein
MSLLNKVFTHKLTIIVLMVLVFYAYNNIILGGIVLIIILGFFLIYLGLVPRYAYVLVGHPYLQMKNDKIVFKRVKGLSLKVIIFGPDGLPLRPEKIPKEVMDEAGRQLQEGLNAQRTGEMLLYKVIGTRVLITIGGMMVLGGIYLLPIGTEFVKEIGFVPNNTNGTQLLEFHRYVVEHRSGLSYKSLNNHSLNFAPDILKVKLLKQPFLFDWRAHFCPSGLIPPLHSLAGFSVGGLCSSVNPELNNLLDNNLLNELINNEDLQKKIAHKELDELLELGFEW